MQVPHNLDPLNEQLSGPKADPEVTTILTQVRSCIAAHRYQAASELLDQAESSSLRNRSAEELRRVVRSLAQSEERRRAFDEWMDKIRAAFDRDDYETACAIANDALNKFPGNAEFVKLKTLAEKQRAAEKTREHAAEEITACRNALVSGQAERAVAQIQSALQKFPDEPALNWLLAAAKDLSEKQRKDVLRADLLRIGRDCIAVGEYAKAIEALERARAEIGGQDIDALLQYANQEQANAGRRRRAEDIKQQADQLVCDGKHDEAIGLVSEAIAEFPDDDLNLVLGSIESTKTVHKSAVDALLVAVRRLVREARFDKCAELLKSQSEAILRDPEVQSISEIVERERERWQIITDAKDKVRGAITHGSFEEAETLLTACERQTGGSLDLKLLRAELESKWTAAANVNVEQALNDARMLSMDHVFTDALRSLERVSIDVRHASDDMRKQYEEQRKAFQAKVAEEERVREQRLKAIAASGGATVILTSAEVEAKIRAQKALVEGKTVIAPAPGAQRMSPPKKSSPIILRPDPFWRRPRFYAVTVVVLAAVGAIAWYVWAPVYVSVNTTPEGVLVRVEDQSCTTPRCEIPLRPGRHTVAASMPGYEPANALVAISSRDRSRGHRVQLSLTPMASLLQVNTNFTSGKVFLDNSSAGTLQNGQLLLPTVGFGSHKLTITADDSGVDLTFDAPRGRPPVISSFKNSPAIRILAISSYDASASLSCNCKLDSVNVDGRAFGPLSSTALQLERLPVGAHLLSVVDGGQQFQSAFDVLPRPGATLFITDKRNIGTLVVTAGTPNADVIVNGKRYSAGPKGLVQLPLEAKENDYVVRVSKRGFDSPPEQHVQVRRNQETRLVFRLQPKQSVIAISAASPGARILLDNVIVATIQPDGTAAVAVAPGKHTIAFEKDGNRSAPQTIQVSPGSNLRISPSTSIPGKAIPRASLPPRQLDRGVLTTNGVRVDAC